jgi:MFS family permease
VRTPRTRRTLRTSPVLAIGASVYSKRHVTQPAGPPPAIGPDASPLPLDGPVAPAPVLSGVLRRVAAALAYRDFRVLWLGACTSSIGTWMQKVAQSWLVLELTDSAWYLALDAFVGELPLLLFTLIGGVIADRRDRRTMLVASQIVQMLSALSLAALVATGQATIWSVIALSFASGCAQAFGGPAYQSLMPSLVPKEHLPNAIALNSIQFNLARLIGPLLAGAALHAFGMVSCFTLNGISFLVVIGALLSLHVRHEPAPRRGSMARELEGGLRYVRGEPRLIALVVLAFATTFLAIPLLTFLPVVAKNVFHEGVGRYSQLMAFSGAGAVAGALVVAWLGRFGHMGVTALVVQAVVGLLIVAFAASRSPLVSSLLLLACGGLLVTVLSLVTSLVQLIAPDEMRGRVMSIYMVAFRGGMPLGSLVTGRIVDASSAPAALAVNGILLAVVAVYFLVRGHGVREL